MGCCRNLGLGGMRGWQEGWGNLLWGGVAFQREEVRYWAEGSKGGHGRMGVDTTGSKAMSRGFMQV